MKYQPNNTVICGLSALFIHGVSNFEPGVFELKVKRSALAVVKRKIKEDGLVDINDYSLVTQLDEFYQLGITGVGSNKIYSLERLVIELDSFEIEPSVRSAIEKEITQRIDFEAFRKLYLKFKTLRKFKVSKLSTKIYKHNIESGKTILSKLRNPKNRVSDVLREYIINNFVNKQKNDCIIKGGSAVQILLPGVDRATNDIDMNSSALDIKSIHDSFTDISTLWFKLYLLDNNGNIKDLEEQEVMEKINEKMKEHKVVKLRLEPKTRNPEIKSEIGNTTMDLSINFTFDDEEIKVIEKEFDVRRSELKIYKGNSIKTFTPEMIIGDKIQHIMKRKEESTRVKDLIDIVMLLENDKIKNKLDISNIVNWITLITKSDKTTVSKGLKDIKAYALDKYKAKFSEAMDMYDIKDTRTFNDYFDILKDLIDQLIDPEAGEVSKE